MKPMDTKFGAIFIILLVLLSIYPAIQFYEKYKNRYYNEAERRLNIDDLLGAISSMQEHVLLNPNDSAAMIQLSDLHMSNGDKDKALKIWGRIVTQHRDAKILGLYDERVQKLVDAAQSASDELYVTGKYEAFLKDAPDNLTVYKLFSRYRYGNSKSEAGRSAPQKYLDTIVRMAYAFKETDRTVELESLLYDTSFNTTFEDSFTGVNNFMFLPSPHYKVLLAYSGILEGQASQLFDEKSWQESSNKYAEAAEPVFRAWEFSADKDAAQEYGRLTWNAAMALKNLEKFTKSRHILRSLLSRCPNECFDQSRLKMEIEILRVATTTFRNRADYDRLLEKASKAFDAQDWQVAYKNYGLAAASARKAKMSESIVAENEFNQGQALANNKEYQTAARIFNRISELYPSYNSEQVKRRLTTMERMDLRTEAEEAFSNDQWNVAAGKYKELAIYIRKNVFDGPLEAQAKYNWAMALSNGKRKREAILVLRKIQREHPQYESHVIGEFVADWSRTCTEFPTICN